MRGWRARARPHGNCAVRTLRKETTKGQIIEPRMDTNDFLKERRENRVEGSAWLARSGAPARQLRRALPEVEMNHEWDK